MTRPESAGGPLVAPGLASLVSSLPRPPESAGGPLVAPGLASLVSSLPRPRLVVLLDGTVVDPDTPVVLADDAGVTRGDGCFETTLVEAGVARDLPEHLDRMVRSAKHLELELPTSQQWAVPVEQALTHWGPGPGVLRLICTRGTPRSGMTAYVTMEAVPQLSIEQRTTGIDVLLLPRGLDLDVSASPWLLTGAKTLSYAMNMAALRYAAAQGADDVLFTSGGQVLEGPRSSVVLATGRTLVSPPARDILDGITVRRLLAAAAEAGWQVERRPVTEAELGTAEGIWLTSSVRLIAAVRTLDGRPVAQGRTPDLARLLQVPGLS